MEGDVDFGDPAETLVLFEGFATAAEGVSDDFVLGGCGVSNDLGEEGGMAYLDLVWGVGHEDCGTSKL